MRHSPDTPMLSRRELLLRAGSGCPMVALSALLHDEVLAAASPVSRGMPQIRPRAKSVIWLFMNGGPSGIDLFDHKPELARRHGQPFPGPIKTLFPYPGTIMGSPFAFSRHGQCGATVSDRFPHLARCVDDITFLKACVSEEQNHVPACYVVNTGNRQVGFPNLGSWITYGLGRERADLPGFIVMYDYRSAPEGGANLWSGGFLPGEHQGVLFRPSEHPILYLKRAPDLSPHAQQKQLELLNWLNRRHLTKHGPNHAWETRIQSFETAYRMQASVPHLVDISRESAATKKLYGIDVPECQHFATQCLLARRMVEQGVRFIQLYHGGYDNNWDDHGGLAEGHSQNCFETDRPIAGLLADLKQRGLFDSTLVIWGGEFGRAPLAQDGDGRDHNPYGFTMWLAGGGVKGGFSHGQTDEFGYQPVEGSVSMHDLHATVLHLLGIDHDQLTFPYGGRDQTPTNGLGRVISEILA